VTGKVAYGSGMFHDAASAKVNAAVVAATGGELPCYAIAGKRVAFRWVSVGSSCVIGRGKAAPWLKWCGADIDQVEAM
jgi:hypothetical protein